MSGFENPKYTQTPNDLFDKLMRNMDYAELKVVLAVIRHTFGYHRESFVLSVRKMAEITGLQQNSVMAGAEAAERHGLIERVTIGRKSTSWRAVVSASAGDTDTASASEANVPQLLRQSASATEEQSGLNKDKESRKKNTEKEEESPPPPNVFKVYEQEIGPLTPMIAEALKDAEDQHTEQWVIEAIHQASAHSARSWSYIKAILMRWAKDGYGQDNRPPPKKPNGNGSSRFTTPLERSLQALKEFGEENGD